MIKRAEGGGSTMARPDEKMGNMRGWPFPHRHQNKLSSMTRKVLKHAAAKKRRQRDKG